MVKQIRIRISMHDFKLIIWGVILSVLQWKLCYQAHLTHKNDHLSGGHQVPKF